MKLQEIFLQDNMRNLGYFIDIGCKHAIFRLNKNAYALVGKTCNLSWQRLLWTLGTTGNYRSLWSWTCRLSITLKKKQIYDVNDQELFVNINQYHVCIPINFKIFQREVNWDVCRWWQKSNIRTAVDFGNSPNPVLRHHHTTLTHVRTSSSPYYRLSSSQTSKIKL